MFKIKSKQTNKIYTVYGSIPELTITWFLIFDDNTWLWVDSVHYEPYEELTQPSYIPIYVPSQPYQPYDPITHPSITWTTNTKPTE